MELVYSRTKTIQEDKVSGFCPGCMHSTVVKLIGEALEEMNLVDKAVMITGIGCCGLHMDYIAYDTITSPHGRACAVATGMKRSNPDTLYFTYQGDGDFASIGLAESSGSRPQSPGVASIIVCSPHRSFASRSTCSAFGKNSSFLNGDITAFSHPGYPKITC